MFCGWCEGWSCSAGPTGESQSVQIQPVPAKAILPSAEMSLFPYFLTHVHQEPPHPPANSAGSAGLFWDWGVCKASLCSRPRDPRRCAVGIAADPGSPLLRPGMVPGRVPWAVPTVSGGQLLPRFPGQAPWEHHPLAPRGCGEVVWCSFVTGLVMLSGTDHARPSGPAAQLGARHRPSPRSTRCFHVVCNSSL